MVLLLYSWYHSVVLFNDPKLSELKIQQLYKGDQFNFYLFLFPIYHNKQLDMSTLLISSCVLPYKGTNFWANHNYFHHLHKNMRVVYYLTKVRISEQITTIFCEFMSVRELCITLQRYEFLSKSQLVLCCYVLQWRCVLPYKGTNFWANHNDLRYVDFEKDVVYYLTKVRISEQITTRNVGNYYNSSCVLPYKGTNFWANHNYGGRN